ncbi:MAG: hypothetical protein H6705_08830 [Myxococcales bacterium]|nr:hypothetical protein [Myxococcales bacterium]
MPAPSTAAPPAACRALAAARRARRRVEQRLGVLAPHHRVGDRVRVPLERIARRAHAAARPDPALLQHRVRRLVRRGVQRRIAVEADLVARRRPRRRSPCAALPARPPTKPCKPETS